MISLLSLNLYKSKGNQDKFETTCVMEKFTKVNLSQFWARKKDSDNRVVGL